MLKKSPIGVSDFRKIRLNKSYYIDKTLFIDDLMSEDYTDTNTFLFPRPRRFGKTLNMSMLSYFFDIQNAEENKVLFEGLAIKETENWKHFGKYPVIFLTFS